MALRVTRQIVEVLATTDAAIRVSRQAVEVLMTEASGGGTEIPVTASSSMSLASDATFNYEVSINASSSLVLVQDAETNIFVLNITDLLDLQQDAEGRQVVINESASSDLALAQDAHRVIEVSASSVLSLTEELYRHYYPSSDLGLSQSADFSRGLVSLLSLTDLVSFFTEYNRSLTSELGLVQSLAYFIDSPNLECLYSPFIGTIGSGVTPPSTTVPTLVKGLLTLTYPYVSPTETLILRNPVFGNAHRFEYQRVNRVSRGGTLIVYADPSWPKQQILVIQVDTLKEDQKNSFLEFLSLSLGKEIGLLDHESRQWKGIITTPDGNVTDNGRRGDCGKYSISFEFEGELV